MGHRALVFICGWTCRVEKRGREQLLFGAFQLHSTVHGHTQFMKESESHWTWQHHLDTITHRDISYIPHTNCNQVYPYSFDYSGQNRKLKGIQMWDRIQITL